MIGSEIKPMHLKRMFCFFVLPLFCFPASPVVGNNWEDLAGERSKFFRATVSDIPDSRDWINRHPWLSEELLFIQSNSRLLVCQNPRGELRYLALPTQVYPVPSGNEVPGMNYAVGMYHHFDSVSLSNLKYEIQFEGDASAIELLSRERPNESFYAAHFLPMTKTSIGRLEATILSFAPVAHDPAKAALSPSPLPGPAGAFYLLRLKNGGETTVKANVLLTVGKNLDGRPAQHATERNTLILSSPKGSAGIHLSNGNWGVDERGNNVCTRAIELKPGHEAVIETRIALGERYADVMPVIHELFLHSCEEWLNRTALFWEERIGRLSVGASGADDEAAVSRDIYYRGIIDNFNCLQTDAEGNLLAHYQGAPKAGTIWGIDYEPTIVSALHISPELARQGILFTMERNRAPRTKYGAEHSTAILVSPLIIARKWLEATGEVEFFLNHPEVMTSLAGIISDLATLKSSNHQLYAARYSSDGPVGRRYDHGTNLKVWFALDSYAYLLEAIGRNGDAKEYRDMAKALAGDIDRTMVRDGPFGPQVSGGTNLGEPEAGFYLPEEVLYYDGEDTGSHLGPVYGVYDFDYKPWVNYHRYARSMFCPSYEPEFGTLRWFPSWSMPVLDGTGFFSRLGGSVTIAEMREALRDLHAMCDETGSLFWWPMGLNFKQGLSRCSQGQGSWAWQYLEQWIGVRIDALSRTITVAPRGLLNQVNWQGLRLGNHTFDLKWEESKTGSQVVLKNRNPVSWRVRVASRPYQSGAQGPIAWKTADLRENGSITLQMEPVDDSGLSEPVEPVRRTEAAKLGEAGIVFLRYGPVDPFPDWYHLWTDEHLDIRLYVLNGTEAEWEEAAVTLRYPTGWVGKARAPKHWPKADDLQEGKAHIELGTMPAMGFAVAPFQIKGAYDFNLDYLTEGKSKHYPSEASLEIRLPTLDVKEPVRMVFEAVLTARTSAGDEIERRLEIPVVILPIAD
jgi:hypothetical protein